LVKVVEKLAELIFADDEDEDLEVKGMGRAATDTV